MTLDARIGLRRGALAIDVQLQVCAGETVALVGPNGAGKTTCLHALAGLVPLEDGGVVLDGHVLDGGVGGPFVPPERRGVGVVFQEPRLFPHLSALQNVAYGLRARGVPTARALSEARAWLQRVGLDGHDDARPEALSGGQAQRVALARALAPSPRLLLLDEPLAAVDATARLELRRELRAHLATFAGPRVLVAHDVTDALALADRLVVVEQGRVVQQGPLAELAAHPRSPYVADLVGLNGFTGVGRDGTVELEQARLTVASTLAGPVLVTIHPRAVSLYRERPAGSPRNVWRAPLESVEPLHDRVRVRLGGPLPVVAEVTPAAVRELALDDGGEVWVAVKATELTVTPR